MRLEPCEGKLSCTVLRGRGCSNASLATRRGLAMAAWTLYRHRNADGSSKDWAVRSNPDGSITKNVESIAGRE